MKINSLQQKSHWDCLTLKMKAVQSSERYFPADKVSHARRLAYSVKCDVQLFSSFSVDSCVMNVLEIAYNCFLINYKACIWGFVSSGVLKMCQVQEWALIHFEAAQWLHSERDLLTHKKSSLHHEISVFLQNFMNHSTRNTVSSQKTVTLNYLVKVLAHNRFLQALFLAPNQLVAAFHYSTYFRSLFVTMLPST